MTSANSLPPARGEDIQAQKRVYFHFGIGCLNVVPKAAGLMKFHPQKYAESIEKSLRIIAGVESLAVKLIHCGIKEEIDLEYGFPDIKYESLSSLGNLAIQISFQLEIPRYYREKIEERFGIFDENLKKFDIKIIYMYHSPVFIAGSWSVKGELDGSGCIILAREYLKMAMTDSNECQMSVDLLGPTPFHADFRITAEIDAERKEDRENRSMQISQQAGYDRIDFTVFGDEEEVMSDFSEIMDNIMHDVDIYYEIQRNRGSLLDFWVDVQEQLDEILDMKSSKGMYKKFSRSRKLMERIEDAVVLCSRFQIQEVQKKFGVRKMIKERSEEEGCLLEKYLQKSADSIEDFPVDKVMNVISFMKERHYHISALLVTVIAACTGGIAGGLLTYVLSMK